jgi:ATP adenylyltransferase
MSASAEPEPLYNLDAARGDAQRAYMADLTRRGVCVFCPENVAREQREPIEWTGEHWYVKRNDYPYEGAREHYLIVARRHVVSFSELPDEAGAELWAVKRRLERRLDPVAALASVERSGDMRFNGGSVAHLHVHLVALDEAPVATVRFRVSARGEDGGD